MFRITGVRLQHVQFVLAVFNQPHLVFEGEAFHFSVEHIVLNCKVVVVGFCLRALFSQPHQLLVVVGDQTAELAELGVVRIDSLIYILLQLS